MYKFATIIYSYFVEKGIDLPYLRTILILVLLFFLHVVQIGLVFKIPMSWLITWNSSESKLSQWWKASLYFGVLITVFCILFKKSTLESKNKELTEEDKRRWKVIIPIYISLSILFLFSLLIKSGIEKGLIG